jgi:hypothetical protein
MARRRKPLTFSDAVGPSSVYRDGGVPKLNDVHGIFEPLRTFESVMETLGKRGMNDRPVKQELRLETYLSRLSLPLEVLVRLHFVFEVALGDKVRFVVWGAVILVVKQGSQSEPSPAQVHGPIEPAGSEFGSQALPGRRDSRFLHIATSFPLGFNG